VTACVDVLEDVGWVLCAVVIFFALELVVMAPRRRRQRYARMLERTARLERELGLDAGADERRADMIALAAREALWRSIAAADTFPGPAVYGWCLVCRQQVMLNRGSCSLDAGGCAKVQYAALLGP
jgi:hypothetical protein